MNNKMKFISNPMLIGAMELAKKNKSPENLKVFMDELLHARLISPIVITPPPTIDENGKAKLTEKNKISIPMIAGPDNKKYFMAFTDMEELKKLKAKGPINVLPFGIRDYAVMMANAADKCDGIAINPTSNGPMVNKAMVAAIMSKVIKKPAEQADVQVVEQTEAAAEGQVENKTEE